MNPGYQWHELLAPANIPNWILAIIGAFGVCAVVKTLNTIKQQTKETARAAKAAEDAARTASQQTGHLIASERAWLVISSLNDPDALLWPWSQPRYWWRVKNVGSTPAVLIESQSVCKVADSPYLDETPPYRQPVSEGVRFPGASSVALVHELRHDR